jgi:hypothetical protein
MDLLINISEIAIITGDNIYKTKREYLIDFWKKNFKDDFDKYKELTSFVKETDEDIITKISNNNKIDISYDLKNCIRSKNTEDLNVLKTVIFEKIENFKEEDKKDIRKSIINITNTNFGIKNENDVTKIYENITGNKILKDNKYHKIKIFQYDTFNVYIGGKIDGISLDNSIIIEVKNRLYKLFYELRNYEKVQIMSYIYLFSLLKGHLVEAHKKKDETKINIIEVQFDSIYMDYIINKIYIFICFFNVFINDSKSKINLLKNNTEIDFNKI